MKLLEQFYDNPAVQAINHKQTGLGNLSLIEEAVLIASAYQKQPQTILIIKNNLYNAQRLYEKLTPLTEAQVLLFGVEESLRMEKIASSPELRAAQMETMAKLSTQTPLICITHAAGAMRLLCDPEQFQAHTLHFKIDEICDFEDCKQKLFEAGYDFVSRVDRPLCYAARGGIIDVYSMNYDHPIRIEFFDNLIESIRFFDISTQRTIQTLDSVEIIPASEYLFSEDDICEISKKAQELLSKNLKKLRGSAEHQLKSTIEQELSDLKAHRNSGSLYKYTAFLKQHFTIMDYMHNPYVIFSSQEEIKQTMTHIQEETIAYIQELSQESLALQRFSLFADPFQEAIKHPHLMIAVFTDIKHPITSQIYPHTLSDLDFLSTMEKLCKQADTQHILCAVDKSELKQIESYLTDHELSYTIQSEPQLLSKGITLTAHGMNEGFHAVNENIVVYTSKELFHKKERRVRYHNKFKDAVVLNDYLELEIGDYIVHHQYGVGKYMGIINKEIDGVHKDFLNIVYKGDDVLLVPLEQFRFIRKFMSKEGAVPKLNKLGSGEWEKTKKKVSGKVAELADRLIALYSLREDHIGHAFSADSPFQRQFEEDFAYELTQDQKQAVAEIKHDMEAVKPMDRLLCGDVGFGKTEVAIRAAFKAVADNKQVAFLCPTTILSIQHYRTFMERFKNYPVTIAVLNRFVSAKDTAKIKQDLADGKIDILIGTHRILSKDICFKDLGFLVIDEEQRFGVEHKEKIKELRNSVDVLSMSATPIPRTLQMSLVGIRSLSQLETPPLNRLPVQTYVIEKDFRMVKEIIQRELARNGQVFYLYNNVSEIYQVARKLREALPDINIAVAHGKMNREEIEDVMLQFTDNAYQVLVCTTIIETGIDIPNANTIIVDQADHFGLAQLYQIKGRVGRSDRLAYAYLMYSPQKQLSELAMKRLKSIKEFTQLGSGYKIAMRDLAIRGAGDMLGPKQAGFIDTVGIDMYIEMLNNAISERKGESKPEVKEMKKANAKVDAYIPNDFAPQDYEKIKLYQRIDEITTKADLQSFTDEIKDNYGHLPSGVAMLFEKKRLDILINEPHVEGYKEDRQQAELSFTQEWSDSIDGVKLFEMMTTLCKDAIIRYRNRKITMRIPKNSDWLSLIIEILERTQHAELKKSEINI